jgi:uncharacterized protein (DUF1015 family)
MPLIAPFAGLRPAPGRAAEVIAPPYDVLDSAEARARAAGKPHSFLHISKAEIDLPPETDPYAPAVYARAAENFAALRAADVLQRDPQPRYYAYRLTWQGRQQLGLVAGASVAAYNAGRIKKHEFTRPAKEDDRVRQIEALQAQTGPVFLCYPPAVEIDARLAAIAAGMPAADVTADDGVRHEFWDIGEAKDIDFLNSAFDRLPALYVADGHHRSAAAARVAAAYPDNPLAQSFLAVIFPHHQLKIMDYNRLVRDLNGHSPESLLAAIAPRFTMQHEAAAVRPARAGEFGLYLAGQWHRLSIRPELISADPVKRLDVSLLHDHLIEPLLGISDPRRDSRIDFVGGIRGLGELERRVDSGEMAVAFSMFPTSLEDLMAVADSGQVMPPKSTWFEPKLADGLVSLLLE